MINAWKISLNKNVLEKYTRYSSEKIIRYFEFFSFEVIKATKSKFSHLTLDYSSLLHLHIQIQKTKVVAQRGYTLFFKFDDFKCRASKI